MFIDAAVVNGMDVVYLLLLMFGYSAVHTGMSVIYCCWCFCWCCCWYWYGYCLSIVIGVYVGAIVDYYIALSFVDVEDLLYCHLGWCCLMLLLLFESMVLLSFVFILMLFNVDIAVGVPMLVICVFDNAVKCWHWCMVSLTAVIFNAVDTYY